MRTFRIGSGEGRKFVILEVQGSRLRVTKGNADGSTRRGEKELTGEAEARSACEEMARELTARGYVERNSTGPARVKAARPVAATSKRASPTERPDGLDLDLLAEAGEGSSEKVEALLPRLAPAAAAAADPKKKPGGKRKKKKRKDAEGGDALDKRVIAGIVGAGLLCVGVVGFLAYEAFLKPTTIVGHWEGSRTEHEIGKFLRNTQYRLILDAQRRVSMSVEEGTPSQGTYAFRGDRLTLSLKGEEGEPSEVRYKVALGGSTLDLFDAASGKKVVQLIRFHDKPAVAGGTPPPAAPKDVAGGPVDKVADDRLASVPFAVKDAAFTLRHPQGWEVETGSRPDNTYSWARFTKGSAKIQVFADVAGSLMAGPNSSDHEEGSEMAPVHGAHVRYKRNASELYGDYQESEPATFKGSALGEGRIATFTASGGGVFGSKLRGIRVTLLTNDRRISVLCEAPAANFERLKPTFLATCRGLAR